MALNSVSLMGRLTSDIEIKTTPAGKSVTNFTLAVNKLSNKDHPEASFIDCVAWNGTADLIAKYFSKGDKLIVTGRLDTSTYESKTGGKVKKTEIIVSEIDFPNNTSNNTGNSKPVNEIKDDGFIGKPDDTDEDPF